MTDYSTKGSPDDIRCSLSHLNPKTRSECVGAIESLVTSQLSEERNKNRITVIKMLQSKQRLLRKMLLTLPNAHQNEKV